MNDLKVISQYYVNNYNGGSKAKTDVEKILKENYNAEIEGFKIHGNTNTIKQRVEKIFFLMNNLKKVDVLIIQCPFLTKAKNFLNAKKKIAFIHDIDGIRQQNIVLFKKEIEFYNSCDVIISLNKAMTELLKKNGVIKPIVELEIWDYLYFGDYHKKNKLSVGGARTIVYAGNLEKSPFINELEEDKMNFNLNVYGSGIEISNNSKISYKGNFKPDDLPAKLKGSLGLVFDGHIEGKDDILKMYTKYNTSHKLSCYLVAGMPVIVWDKSGVAKFVKNNNIGYLISNVYDINNIDYSDIDEKRKNVEEIRKKVINGEFIKSAIDKALKICKED